MSFISLSFLIFFPIVTVGYFLLPQRLRWAWLLVASCIFYASFIPAYLLVLFALIVVDYTVAIQIEKSAGRRRLHLVWISIAALVGALFFFKYFNFFNTNLAILFALFGAHYPIGFLYVALPLGLSFHTFQSLSYVIEVYRGKQKAERHLGIYALYVMFYPQLVAGPIERPQQLLYQFYDNHRFEYERVKMGLIRMAWGFFKKIAIANNLGLLVTPVYGNPHAYGALTLLAASVAFTLQLYFDFSAYCDIGIGAAQVMGFTLMENFNRPFASQSMSEFWTRWHISLSSWFRDYFYFPLLLSSKRRTPVTIYAAVLLTFLVTGFWHGANWTFGVFGLLHGSYIVIGAATKNMRTRLVSAIGLMRIPWLYRALQALCVFMLMCITTVFFRAVSVGDGWYILSRTVTGAGHALSRAAALQLLDTASHIWVASFALALAVFLVEYLSRKDGIFAALSRQRPVVRWGAYALMLYLTIALNTAGSVQFIYFQF